MSKCSIRLVIWLFITCASVIGGITTDFILKTGAFPVFLRCLGLIGMLLAHFPLKRTGRLLRLAEGSKEWGCTDQLITIDIYQCVRHPHHAAIGLFVVSLGLLIGHPWSFLVITITQWTWIIGFLFLVEEKELLEKFGQEYKVYRRQVPMLFPKLFCIFKVLLKPIDISKGNIKLQQTEGEHREASFVTGHHYSDPGARKSPA